MLPLRPTAIRTTKVDNYSEEGKKAGERTVSRSLNAGFQSEWETDDDGGISIVASSSELKEQNDYALQYIQKVYATAAKENTSLSGATQRSVAPGSAVSGSIAENHGVPEENGGQYCLSLMVENTGSSYVEISVGGIKKSVINVNHDSKAYYIIPVPYYSKNASTAIEIKNLGENYVYVSNVSYNHCESVKDDANDRYPYGSVVHERDGNDRAGRPADCGLRFQGQSADGNADRLHENAGKRNNVHVYVCRSGNLRQDEFTKRKRRNAYDGVRLF